MITDRIDANVTRVPFAGCWLWTKSVGSHGYGQMMFADKKPRLVHRLAYEAYVGPIPEGLHVLHRCDTRSCCNPEHLFVGTAKDNMQDCKRKGRMSKPPVGASAKTTKVNRDEAVKRYKTGDPAKKIAADLGVHVSRVYQLARGNA